MPIQPTESFAVRRRRGRCLSAGALSLILFLLLALLTAIRAKGETVARSGDDGFLQVYSATDEFNDGGTPYYAHSSYIIYTADGTRFRNIENHLSRSDVIPELVRLPAGKYFIDARSDADGYVRLSLTIKASRTTTINLEQSRTQSFVRWE